MRRKAPGVSVPEGAAAAPGKGCRARKNICNSMTREAFSHWLCSCTNTHVSAMTRSSFTQLTKVGSSTGPYGAWSSPQMV